MLMAFLYLLLILGIVKLYEIIRFFYYRSRSLFRFLYALARRP